MLEKWRKIKFNGKLLKYYFYNSEYCNCTYNDAIHLLNITTKPIMYATGLYKYPEDGKQISNLDALEYMNNDTWYDIIEYPKCVFINHFNANDMW